MKIPSSIIRRLNNRYVTTIDVHGKIPNDFIWIIKGASAFLDKAIRRGNGVSLNDIDYELSEKTFWDIEHFEDFCQNIYFTFKSGFTTKLIRRLPSVDKEDLNYFRQILERYPTAYMNAINHPTDPYLHFIGKKLSSLNNKNMLIDVMRLDKANRQLLLSALQQQTIAFQQPVLAGKPVQTPSKSSTPFTNMLKAVSGSVNNTKALIQEQITLAGIPFELFIPKPVIKTTTNKNPDGFNGAIAAMITVFKELGYFKTGISFPEILDAFLKETGNTIGKLNNFKRNYMADNYYMRYKESLEELNLEKYQENT